ncbi:DUF5059 domain-containing protein [Halostella pelagica]|uniref:DUF5059 domain-containing protein n=1 Tax=Halostella pelagica TaxID=2583824 RepID=UPI0010800126|nr:DUF5059 domain-containing protein [Halostella pelagica]
MRHQRRDLLRSIGAVGIGLGLAGCSSSDDEAENDDENPTEDDGSDDSDRGPEAAVAAEWNVYRARLYDAVALGEAGDAAAGARVAGETFEDFENAGGEYGAHELLERTDEDAYEGFEGGLGALRTDGLEDGDVARARDAADRASESLADAQEALTGEDAATALALQQYGARAADVAALTTAGRTDAAASVGQSALDDAESSGVTDRAEDFADALSGAVEAANGGDAEAAAEEANAAFSAAMAASYDATDEEVANAGHLAAFGARGRDAAALSALGGPGKAFGHAAALTVYRVLASDARWLAAQGATDAAATTAEAAFSHFEAADAHDALEAADDDAYEGFEDGLGDLQSALADGDGSAADEALAAVDENLRAGVDALVGGEPAAVLQSGFFRARFADVLELYRLGAADAAVAVARGLFERFEADEAGFHEAMEETDESLYDRFEHDHLEKLVEAMEEENDNGVESHYDGVQSALLEFEAAVGGDRLVAGAETSFFAGRAFDAAALTALDEHDRASAVAEDALAVFEAGAGGYHEALETADHEAYETFEDELAAVGESASSGGDVLAAAERFHEAALVALDAVLTNGGGGGTDAAARTMQDAFSAFEEARVHDALESADAEAYETFEDALENYAAALEEGDGASEAAAAYADATLRAQFAVVGAPDDAPLDESSGENGDDGDEQSLSGGPNVVDGVPDDADHVVSMQRVAYEPEELTVAAGDTVAFEHAAGEPHSVTAYGADIPDDAAYWASGGFESEDAARKGWENGEGAVQSGQSYVRTFETAGEHDYFCVPHERAGMEGTIVVEE